MKNTLIVFCLALCMSFTFISCGGGEATESTQQTQQQTEQPQQAVEVAKNVVETAIASEAHTTLVAAVKAAELVETLSGEGPFTVFAPTNAAFEALPEGTVENLLKPESKEALTGVLTYHVVPGKALSSDLTDGQKIATVNGAELTVSIADGVVKIDGATVTAADLECSNGVIHVIDAVVLPAEK